MGEVQDPDARKKAIIDPTHPEAGRGGVVPPEHSRFKPGYAGGPGRPKGASAIGPFLRDMAKGAVIDAETGEVIKYGDRSEEMAQVLYELCVGKRDPASVDIKALGIAIDRVDGPIVKERIQTNIELVEGIELRDRRKDAPPVPGTEKK